MPRVRRPRRQAPVLELLEATLPELRRGLDRVGRPHPRLRALREARLRRGRGHGHPRGARVRRRGGRPPRGRRPADPARLRSAGAAASAARAARDPHGVPAPGLPARRRRGRAAAADRRPGRRRRRLRHGGIAARRDGRRDARPARHPALRAAAAVGAPLRDDDRAAGADGAALRLQRVEHDRVVHPHRAGTRAPARARVRGPSAQPARAAGRVHHARGGAASCAQLPRARAGAVRRRSSR